MKKNHNELDNDKDVIIFQNKLTDKQKYELALIELVYNIKPFKYQEVFNMKTAKEFIKKHRVFIDKNIVIEKHVNGNSYVFDKEENFYGIIYKGNNDGIWNNSYYIKNELIDEEEDDMAEDIYYSVALCSKDDNYSMYKVINELNLLGRNLTEKNYYYINRVIDKFKHKITLDEHLKYLDNARPQYNPFK